MLNSVLAANTILSPQTDRLSWGQVELQVTDLDRAVAFWTMALGLIERDHSAPGIGLGTKERTLIVLHPGAETPVKAPFTGMYHVAIGVRSQAEFSRMLARLIHLNIQVGPTVRIPEHPATHSDNIRPLIPEYPATCDALP